MSSANYPGPIGARDQILAAQALAFDPTLLHTWYYAGDNLVKVQPSAGAGGSATLSAVKRSCAWLQTSASAGGFAGIFSGDSASNANVALVSTQTDAFWLNARINVPTLDANTVIRVGWFNVAKSAFVVLQIQTATGVIVWNNNTAITSITTTWPDTTGFHDVGFRSNGTTYIATLDGVDQSTTLAAAAANSQVGMLGVQAFNNSAAAAEQAFVNDMFYAVRPAT